MKRRRVRRRRGKNDPLLHLVDGVGNSTCLSGHLHTLESMDLASGRMRELGGRPNVGTLHLASISKRSQLRL